MSDFTRFLGLFPGQGSQNVGMARPICKLNAEVEGLLYKADKVLGFELSRLMEEGPIEELTLTEVAQPALLFVASCAYNYSSNSDLTVGLGHSLGEYSALVAAGSIDLFDALTLVNKRGKFMQEAVPAGVGGMIAVLGASLEYVSELCSKVKTGVAEIANINAPGQIVVSGELNGLVEFEGLCTNAKVRRLPVSAPFHSSLMKSAADRLAIELDATNISTPNFPVYSNFYAIPLSQPSEIRDALKQQVCGRVRFTECLNSAKEKFSVAQATEFGTGSVLSGLVKRSGIEIECTQFP
jgi:[acyl-carrier-protein] S-malonyltransferase